MIFCVLNKQSNIGALFYNKSKQLIIILNIVFWANSLESKASTQNLLQESKINKALQPKKYNKKKPEVKIKKLKTKKPSFIGRNKKKLILAVLLLLLLLCWNATKIKIFLKRQDRAEDLAQDSSPVIDINPIRPPDNLPGPEQLEGSPTQRTISAEQQIEEVDQLTLTIARLVQSSNAQTAELENLSQQISQGSPRENNEAQAPPPSAGGTTSIDEKSFLSPLIDDWFTQATQMLSKPVNQETNEMINLFLTTKDLLNGRFSDLLRKMDLLNLSLEEAKSKLSQCKIPQSQIGALSEEIEQTKKSLLLSEEKIKIMVKSFCQINKEIRSIAFSQNLVVLSVAINRLKESFLIIRQRAQIESDNIEELKKLITTIKELILVGRTRQPIVLQESEPREEPLNQGATQTAKIIQEKQLPAGEYDQRVDARPLPL